MEEKRSTADRGFNIEGEKDTPLTTIPYPNRRRKESRRAAMLREDTGTRGLDEKRSSSQLGVFEEHQNHAEECASDMEEEFHGKEGGEELCKPREVVQEVDDGNLE